MNHPTIKDIADKCGVSANTVSRALRDKSDIGARTKQMVRQAAERMGYLPNPLAQGLKGRPQKILGVLVADLSNPFFAAVVNGIAHTAGKEGYQIIVASSEENPAREKQAITAFAAKRIDGMIFTPASGRSISWLAKVSDGMPYMAVARIIKDQQYNYVISNDFQGALSAVNHLIEKGHRRILFLNGPNDNYSSIKRLAGYRRALEQAGIPADPGSVIHLNPTLESAKAATGKIMAAGTRFTAIFCFNDYMAFGVLQVLQEKGLKVPGDMSVAGYDNINFSRATCPPLTTVDAAMTNLGRRAAEALIKRIETRRDMEPVVLEPRLIVRASTGSIA
ncbi:MAG: LacI family DNA-binding transcriptional regulator [Bacillota bacterium]